MIVHETDDEAEEPSDAANRPDTTPEEPPGPSTRRKAKETQYRLGVGRPTAIGGSGPRAVTTSGSKPRSKRTKGSASVQPTEHVIREEEEGKAYLNCIRTSLSEVNVRIQSPWV